MIHVTKSQKVEDKLAELNDLFSRIVQITEAMGGDSAHEIVSVSHMNMTVAEPCCEGVPTLRVDMTDGFCVEFIPSGPLSTPYLLNVNVRRIHKGYPKNGNSINFVNDAWRLGQTALSDDQIRAWLTLDGLPPPAY